MSAPIGLDDASGKLLITAYLRSVCEPLLDEAQVDGLTIEAVGGPFHGEFTFRLTATLGGGAFLVGRQGAGADAIRLLVRSRARAIGWDARVDVRISRAD